MTGPWYICPGTYNRTEACLCWPVSALASVPASATDPEHTLDPVRGPAVEPAGEAALGAALEAALGAAHVATWQELTVHANCVVKYSPAGSA